MTGTRKVLPETQRVTVIRTRRVLPLGQDTKTYDPRLSYSLLQKTDFSSITVRH